MLLRYYGMTLSIMNFNCEGQNPGVSKYQGFFHIHSLSFSVCSLHQVDENRKAVTTEIKKSICNLIMEINRKGKILVNQLEVCFLKI